jgi:DHA2 family multidrug resistance protein
MEVLDTSIANIALPHIARSFGASTNESTWVLTSYLVSNGIVLPMSAWLATRFGRKRYYMTCVALFAISSFFCGLAPSLGALVFFRVLQGIGGGGLQPSEQSILSDAFPPEKRGQAFAFYGMAVVVAPAIGPMLGGWITDSFSWRWIFYINVPISILSLYLTHRVVEDPPYLARERERRKGAGIDYIGVGLVALGVGCLQLVMDKGQELDWFGSHWIVMGLVAAVALLAFWIWWELHTEHPIVELRLLKRRNVGAAMFFMMILGMVLNGSTVLLPEFTQNLMGYPAVVAGEALAGGGLVMMLMMPISGTLVAKVDPRKLMAFGFASTAAGLYWMAAHLTLTDDFRTIFLLRVYQVAGLAFIFIPNNVMCYVGVPRENNNQISSMINFVRNIGGSIGIAIITTMVSRGTQQRSNYLTANLQPGNPRFQQMLNGMAASLRSQGVSAADAMHQAYGRMEMMVQQQAATLAFADVVGWLALLVFCLVPFAFLMKRPPKHSGPDDAPPAH